MTKPNFPVSDPSKSLADLEQETLKFWQEKDIFQKTLEHRNPNFPFKFFDGPPFATGSPHYGHILAGAIKDAIPRYKTMQGYHVARKWGWDCHGVPVEFQVEKEHQIGGKPGIEKMGVGKFNELCRSVVLRCADEWRATVARMGRFVDTDNDYKTMDPEFMESVWWVFGQLWDKGLIYEGEKVIAYSPKLGSPLSNFEANLNYSDIDDPAVTVKFELTKKSADFLKVPTGTSLLAWTTTPWTLPSNLALCVNPEIEYGVIECTNPETNKIEYLILATSIFKKWQSLKFKGTSFEKYFKGVELDGNSGAIGPSIVKKIRGKNLMGQNYVPLFPFFKDHKNAFQILGDDFVSDSDGTGIVHMATNFGEEDARVCADNDVHYLTPNPIDENGYFKDEAPLSQGGLGGLYFRADPEVAGSKESNANDWVLQNLGDKMFDRKQIRHSYPHCWRTDCALMYRGIKTWFVDVKKIKAQMIEQNQNINWIPDHLKDGRFGKMLESAPDWAISRNRYWGCPIPVWKCDKTGEVQAISSRAELESLCGKPVDDLHKHFVDDLTWPSPFDRDGTMVRIPEVLDCWFESGAMPYGSVHYPFKNSADFLGTNQLTVVRHGEAENNTLNIASCLPNTEKNHGLTEKGQEQVKKSAEKIGDIDLIITSPYRRTKETAEIFAATTGAQIIEDDRLREIDHPSFDGTNSSNFETWEAENTNITVHYPNGENIPELEVRVRELLKDIKGKYHNKKILLVSHGLTVQATLKLTNDEPQTRWENQIKNAETYPLTKKSADFSDFEPADFIAEGLDQTRGWFYTLHVLGCALFGENIYKNVITNGIILAEDGQKMSKSKKNYPDPNLVFDKYGADAMRFYLLSSPVVRGENFRFTEHGVQEVLKSIILPLKSTYQFFSTYANIDNWQPTKFLFVRHGEAEHNVRKIYSGVADNPHHLTELGKQQVTDTADYLTDFDVMIRSPFVRTKETAEIIKKIRGFSGDMQVDARVCEPSFGNLEGKNWINPLDRYANKTTEHPLDCQKRVNNFINDMNEKFRGKTLLVVSHGSPIRNAEAYENHINSLEDMVRIRFAQTGRYRMIFPHPRTENELDQWILSELHTLIKNYRTAFDAYNLEGALRHIAPFIDNLNNWYLRRSRRRFWANGLDADKIAGYETLHHVLFNLSKILAPICPFFAEKLYQDLGGYGSVHLEFMPHCNASWIKPDLETNIALTREIISLAAGIRARAKIKLRQPLGKLQFSTTTNIRVDLEIIKAEANVKNIEIINETELKKFAQKIVRVNAKLVGKKFGAKVQELIQKGKSGDFEALENGQIKIAGELLEANEYEVGFITDDGVEAEATARTVVLLDTEITAELKTEGLSRELIRTIQDLRKSNGFEVSDRIEIHYATESAELQEALEKFGEKIGDETLANEISAAKLSGEAIEIDGETIIIKLKKV